MRRIILFFTVLSFSIIQILAANPQEAVDKFIKTSGVPSASLAVKIVDLDDSSVLGAHNSDTSLVPASILKSVTTAALFDLVGPDWKYHTKVYIDGPIDMGILRGNIIVVGACDPSLHSLEEPFGNDLTEEITEALKNLFITQVEGEIIVDESEFAGTSRPSSWQREDFSKSYGTGSHALNFSNNSIGDRSVENPGDRFVKTLTDKLSINEIHVEKKNIGEGRRIEILDHQSPPIDEIMRSCMMRSDNLFAECLLRTYGKLNGSDGSTEASSAKEMENWISKGYNMEGIEIVDGSGLSRKNRVTADFMAKLLSNMSSDATYASFFPLAGQEGTLKKFLAGTELDSYIAMKTGSMNGIQCYAGYKLDEDYVPTHAIVIIMNEIGKNRDKAKKAAQTMLLEIFSN